MSSQISPSIKENLLKYYSFGALDAKKAVDGRNEDADKDDKGETCLRATKWNAKECHENGKAHKGNALKQNIIRKEVRCTFLCRSKPLD